MTQVDLRKDRVNALNERLKEWYSYFYKGQRLCFRSANGRVFRLDDMGSTFNAVVVEYEDEYGAFEDGDPMYMDEMSETEMFAAILQEAGTY